MNELVFPAVFGFRIPRSMASSVHTVLVKRVLSFEHLKRFFLLLLNRKWLGSF